MKTSLYKQISFKKLLLLPIAAFFALSLLGAHQAHAMTPTLNVALQSDGNTVQVNVTGDPGQSVILFYQKTGQGVTIQPFGTTSSNGTFSIGVSSSQYGVVSGSQAYVSTGGIYGSQSLPVSWPYVTGGSGTLSLSQTGVSVSTGQSTSVSVTNNGSGSIYLSNNSNPSIANISVSGSQINITGVTNGSTVATICSTSNTGTCPTLYITVQGSTSGQTIYFSQNNLTVTPVQNVPITISGGTGSYIVSNTSNPGVVSSSISGNIITLYTSSTSGSTAITVCSSDMSACGVLNASAGTTNGSSQQVTFSQSNPTLSVGQSTTISLYGGTSGTYYISNNSNPSAVSANLTNSTTLSLSGIANGYGTLTVCASSGGCGTLTVTVNYAANGGSVTLSQSSISVQAGQSATDYISGSGSYYVSTNTNPSIASVSINANVVTVSAYAAGSTNISLCGNGSACTMLYVTVTGGPSSNSYAGCTSSAGFSTVTGQSCAGYTGGSSSGTVVTGTPAYTFVNHLTYGDTGTDVLQLQQLLAVWGFLSATPNGRFGPATQAAVEAFQSAHGISPTGEVGPATRNALNQAQITAGGSSSTKAAQIQAIQLQIQQLQAQLVVLQNS